MNRTRAGVTLAACLFLAGGAASAGAVEVESFGPLSAWCPADACRLGSIDNGRHDHYFHPDV